MVRRVPRVAWFVVVGCAAAAVHWLTVVGLVELWAWRPLTANVVGWLVALTVSFAGHHHLTFRGHGASAWRSAGRFFLVSGSGFIVNEVTYAALLHWSGVHYEVILGSVLIGVAVMTWWLSRVWVFRGSSIRP